jgi:hypothetical protein
MPKIFRMFISIPFHRQIDRTVKKDFHRADNRLQNGMTFDGARQLIAIRSQLITTILLTFPAFRCSGGFVYSLDSWVLGLSVFIWGVSCRQCMDDVALLAQWLKCFSVSFDSFSFRRIHEIPLIVREIRPFLPDD